MDPVKVFQIKEDITSRNNKGASDLKKYLKEKDVFYINLMSSPGSGKTSLLIELINSLKNKFKIGVIETDIDSDRDGKMIYSKTGCKTVQINTNNCCHITYQMSKEALECLGLDDVNLVFLENIGNLVCPAEFDTGANLNLVLLSVCEGDDKPLKYPLMFEKADAVIITKTDVLDCFDFSIDKAKHNILLRNSKCNIFDTSIFDQASIEVVKDYLLKRIFF